MTDTTLAAPKTLGRGSNGSLMTPEEFDAVTDFDRRFAYELIRGVVVVGRHAAPTEAGPNDELGFCLRQHLVHHPNDATLPVRHIRTRSGTWLVHRAIWAGLGRCPDPDHDPPTVAVEFVSWSRRRRQRDYGVKSREVIDAGVAEYWIIDRFRRTMTVVRPGPGGPTETVLPESAVYTTPLLPGFELPLARLLAAADRWATRR